MQYPLSGVRVIDLTRILSGPFCTMLLGDMGADVIKIESPEEGDPIRKSGQIREGLSWYFAAFNRNKRSLRLDLKDPGDKAVLTTLLRDADVLVENFRPGVLEAMGFDKATLRDINPRLIVAGINGYGRQGPYAKRPAFDFVIQAMSGFMSVNGERDGDAMRSGTPITDLIAGLYAAFGIVNALRYRDQTGSGQHVEVAMMSAITSMFAYLASDYLASGVSPTRNGNDHPIASPYGMFRTKDGDIAVAPSTDAILLRFLEQLGLERLLEDGRFKDNSLRVQHRAALNELINERLQHHTQDHWIERLNRAGVPCGRVQSVGEALTDAQMLAQSMVIDVEHPGYGNVQMLGFPVKLSESPCTVHRPAPRHGEHDAEILSELQRERKQQAVG